MTLVDTSVWVDHLGRGDKLLAAILEAGEVECHPFVIGELACGRLRRREEILALLRSLPQVPMVEHDEVLSFVEARSLAGQGIGWVDAHLLASAILGATTLWTRDKRLAAVARTIGVLCSPAV